jgi:flavin-dependent dehydrogenase
VSQRDEYRVGDMPRLYESAARAATEAGVRIAVSPLTAGGLDPCMRLSELAASVLDAALCAGTPDALAHYDGATLRANFRGRLLMRRALAEVRAPVLASAAFALLRTPFGRPAAARILFGDGSFPDTVPTYARTAAVTAAAPAGPSVIV